MLGGNALVASVRSLQEFPRRPPRHEPVGIFDQKAALVEEQSDRHACSQQALHGFEPKHHA